ncbi:MAG: hypothetical protein ACC645_16180, partial [Pirellulales bacterium]
MRSILPLQCVVGSFLIALSTDAIGAEAADGAGFKAVDHARKAIYHSPQSPGYTCWTGAWLMPAGDIMVSFTQATGPVQGRLKAPPQVMKKLS